FAADELSTAPENRRASGKSLASRVIWRVPSGRQRHGVSLSPTVVYTQLQDNSAMRLGMRTAEAMVEGSEAYMCAEPEIAIGELDGPVGTAMASLLGGQVKGHTRVFALLDCDVQVRPATLMVSKVTVGSEAYTNILMGSVQAAIANGV